MPAVQLAKSDYIQRAGTLFTVDLRYTVLPGCQMMVKVHNVLNRRCETFGVLGTNFSRAS